MPTGAGTQAASAADPFLPEKETAMKKFFAEFKKFITRGNVVDMAVGVIVGSSFTAIVNGLSNNILKPIINWFLALILGKDSLSELYTFLTKVEMVDETGATVVDLANSIYIDWGAFINAVINFFLVAFVLFCIVRIVNRAREKDKKFKESLKPVISREDHKAMKKQGIKAKDSAAVAAYFAAKAELPVVKSTCPADGNTEREEMKKLLASLERENKGLRYRIFGAIQRGEIDGFREIGKMQGIKNYSED